MAEKNKGIPMNLLVNSDENMYELTNACIHRAEQISLTGSERDETTEGKIVSKAISEVVSEEVKYEYKR